MADEKKPPAKPMQEVRYEYTPNFPQILQHLGATLLVSTYQAGKMLTIGVHDGKLAISFSNFDRAMGLAVGGDRLAIGSRRQIHFLRGTPDLGPRIEPVGTHDCCWTQRSSFVTGNIHGHELAWGADGLWVVNTLFSCLCVLHDDYNFVPRWRPRFITELADQDRCHLNGVAIVNGQPAYVTVMAQTNDPAGWRPNKATTGTILDIASGEPIMTGLAMPHSPRWDGQRLWVLNSGYGSIGTVDRASGKYQTVETMPGYTRGLAILGQFAFVGLSRIRETSVFGGVPIAEKRDELKCGVGVVDLATGKAVAAFQFHTGVEEIFAIDLIPGQRNPHISTLPADGEDVDFKEIWIVPPPTQQPPPQETRPPVYARPLSQQSSPTIKTPTLPELTLLCQSLQQQGRNAEAAQCLELIAAQSPLPAPHLVNLGNLRQTLDDQPAAVECYKRAVGADPKCLPARQNLGYLLFNRGETDEAVAQFEALLKLDRSPINQLLAALVFPVVYQSESDVHRWRRRLTDALDQMVKAGVTVDASQTLVPTTFFLAYQGMNDRSIMQSLGKIIRGEHALEQGKAWPKRSGKKRIGFLSAYFRNHTIGRLNLGRIEHLDRSQFEVVVLSAGGHQDPIAKRFQQAADRHVVLSRDLRQARQGIIDQQVDVLVHADFGMDSLTSTLAWSRLAPRQVVTWGHPDTTGSPAMDEFFSSDWLDEPAGGENYTEKLVRLPLLGTYYERPPLPTQYKDRAAFGLPTDKTLYVCPQTLFKFHPSFDPILRGILEQDPRGELVVIEGRAPAWTERLKRRWQTTMPGLESRVRWLPALPFEDFLSLLSVADVLLDSPTFSGGNSSYESFAVGTPVVTQPGPLLRSRITAALYRKMGITDLIADGPDEYIRFALRLGADKDFNQHLRTQIRDRSSILFNDPAEIAGWNEALAR